MSSVWKRRRKRVTRMRPGIRRGQRKKKAKKNDGVDIKINKIL